jgi:hypothetical protein
MRREGGSALDHGSSVGIDEGGNTDEVLKSRREVGGSGLDHGSSGGAWTGAAAVGAGA